MKLVVGLGNPGIEYEQTRHNVGFLVLDRLARRYAPGETPKGRFHGALLEGSIEGEKLLLLKPGTYMNRSGMSVAEAVRFFKIEPANDLLVIVDDLALPCGSIRLRAEGGAGGHNGLADIQEKLATSGYARLRIGIDAPGDIPQSNYVLGRFRPDQLEKIEPALNAAAEAAASWATHGIIEAMNRHNRKDSPESSQAQS
ncbi:MAG TPA: aminoacyl-tRNA hydrolase [Phycisphaerales bacterium]|nr:aminoacyl-tRNA hydrolase [Phycisphaerales bacterium]